MLNSIPQKRREHTSKYPGPFAASVWQPWEQLLAAFLQLKPGVGLCRQATSFKIASSVRTKEICVELQRPTAIRDVSILVHGLYARHDGSKSSLMVGGEPKKWLLWIGNRTVSKAPLSERMVIHGRQFAPRTLPIL